MSMSNNKARMATLVLSFGTLVIVIGTVASTHGWIPFKTPFQEIAPNVTNKTTAVRIINVKKVGEGVTSDIEVTLLNQSDKRILAYTFAYGEESMTTLSISLAPGQTMIERMPFGNVESAARNNPSRAGELRFSAVYFEGGASEGEPEEVARLSSRMLGIKEQAKLALQILRNAQESSEPDSEGVMQAVESQVSSLPTNGEHFERPSEAQSGKASINWNVLSRMKEIRKNKGASAFDQRRRLENMIRSYEQLATTL